MNRITYFDTIRGFLMIWVLITHISLNYGIITFGEPVECHMSPFLWMSFFMVPFYVFSGYFFSFNKSFKAFVNRKAKKLLIPYCTFTLFGIIVYTSYYILTGYPFSFGFIKHLIKSGISTGGLVSNTPCWFFISLFLCNLLYYILNYTGPKWINFWVFVLFSIAWLSHNKPQFLGYGNVLLGTVYIHLGNLLRVYENKLDKLGVLIFAIAVYLIIGLFDAQQLAFVLNYQVQGNYLLNCLFSISACYILWFIAKRMTCNNFIIRYVTFLGANSLILFASHRVILNWICEPIIRRFYQDCSYAFFLLCSLLAMLMIYHVIDFIIKRCCPKLVGQF